MLLLPPPSLFAVLTSDVFNRSALRGLPDFEAQEAQTPNSVVSRRGFLGATSASLMAFSGASFAEGTEPLIFSPNDKRNEGNARGAEGLTSGSAAAPSQRSRPGEIPPDFWSRPRELWLRRQGTSDEVRVVYWKDGKLLSEGYWAACSLLRDVRANVMTAIDPTVLDVLRGISGYYQAWNWPHPIVATSGYRTANTNDKLSKEGAAKNSMHLFGKAVDLFVPGIPSTDIGKLGQYLQQGGVGFYPDRGFTHLDTGKLRSWQGR